MPSISKPVKDNAPRGCIFLLVNEEPADVAAYLFSI